jgi:DNA-nicking Smr family endonuclease
VKNHIKLYAQHLREQGLSYTKIGKRVGVGTSTVQVWLNTGIATKARERSLAWKQANTERAKASVAAWRRANPEKVKASLAAWQRANPGKSSKNAAIWNKANPDYFRKYVALKYRNDPQFKMAQIIRKLTRRSYRGVKKPSRSVTLLGCTQAEFRTHLESLFQPGMSHENYGEWHIDHIRPLASFDLTQEDQRRASCHYTNLQPLWAKDNLSKGAKRTVLG